MLSKESCEEGFQVQLFHRFFPPVFVAQQKGNGALVISGMLDFLSFSLCSPYSETTEGKCFEQLLQLVANLGRSFYRLFQVLEPAAAARVGGCGDDERLAVVTSTLLFILLIFFPIE